MSDENAFFVFNETSEIEFKELYGLTFVFTKNTIKINGKKKKQKWNVKSFQCLKP